MKKASLIDLIYDILWLLPLAFIVTILTKGLLGFEEMTAKLWLLTAGVSVFLVFFRAAGGKGKLILLSFVIELAVILILIRPAEKRLLFFPENLWAFEAAGLVLAVFLVLILSRKVFLLKPAVALALIACLVISLVTAKDIDRITVILSFFVILLSSAETIQHFWKKAGNTDHKKHLVCISPFLLAVLLVMGLIKAPEEPYDWYFARSLYASAADFFDRLSVTFYTSFGDSYENVKVGFSESGHLPGAETRDPKDVMTVTLMNSRIAVIYLSGKTFDTFDGHDWTVQNTLNYNDSMIDVIESHAQVSAQDPSYLTDYLRWEKIDVAYRKFKSRTVFAPLKAVTGEKSLEQLKVSFPGADVRSDMLLSHKDPYSLYFYRLNRNGDLFDKLVNNARPVKETMWDKTAQKYADYMGNYITYEEYLSYRESVKTYYTQDLQLTPRTEAWLKEAVAGCETDLEKLRALERAFQGFGLNNAPGSIPDSVTDASSFLDFFIFERPEGFCSYYATAFTLLARSLGLPARYVQGYLVPTLGETEVNVNSAMAHAWSEVYLENFGWAEFEPTPGKYINTSWAVANRNPKPDTNKENYDRPEIPEEDHGHIHQDDEDPPEEETPGFKPLYVILPAALVLLSALLILLLELRKIKKNYEKATDNEKICLLFKQNMKLLSFLSVSIKEGETLDKYRTRAASYFTEDPLGFIGAYQDVIYGDLKVTEEGLEEALNDRAMLFTALKKEHRFLFPLYKLLSFFRLGTDQKASRHSA